ncbi:MAG: DoxX family protein [Acetobacteraceae bacterium]|nr:DoxX family protein [Acetobacteraceae bacterium]
MRNITFETWRPYVLSLLRIMTALLLLEHGTQKLLGFPPGRPGPEFLSLIWFAGLIELVGGALLLLGLFTRPVAFLLSGELAFAYFMAHAPRGFFPILNGGELAVLYCWVFFYLTFAGGGPLSLDRLLRNGGALPARSPAE